jgi:cytochrome c oxidase cbb3-type subunit 3
MSPDPKNPVKIDAISGTPTTGHEWDGIRELNTPLPRWWVIIFIGTIVWSVFYVIAYPAIPLKSSFTKGVLGWSSRDAVGKDIATLRASRGPITAALAKASLQDIEKDPGLLEFARAQGKAAFADNCAPCHGAGGGGSKGYPNLNDDIWIWGGTLDAIFTTISHGVRSGDAQGHDSAMPAFGRDGVLSKAEISNVADYVHTLSGQPAEKGADVAGGAKLFAQDCAPCHGVKGAGNQEIGAPNLTAHGSLYGADKEVIVQTLNNGRGGVMPAWGGRLDLATLKALTVYIHTLGGGQ